MKDRGKLQEGHPSAGQGELSQAGRAVRPLPESVLVMVSGVLDAK